MTTWVVTLSKLNPMLVQQVEADYIDVTGNGDLVFRTKANSYLIAAFAKGAWHNVRQAASGDTHA